MLVKLIISAVLAGATFILTQTASYAVYVFLIAAVVAFVLEGVRVVPQQKRLRGRALRALLSPRSSRD